MKNNIITVTFGEACVFDAEPLTQYDRGQILAFTDIPDGTEVQFQNGATTINHIVDDGKVSIPDIQMDKAQSFKAWVMLIDENSQTTVKTINLRIKPKTKPSDYIAPEDEPTFREEIEGILNETKAIAESVREDADEGKFDGEKGDKGDKGDRGEQGAKGDKGDKGDAYEITEEDYQEIADLVPVKVNDVQINGSSIVTDGVANVPVATTDKAGAVRLGGYGTIQAENGRFGATTINEETYKSQPNAYMIGKGTLENIKNDLTKRAITDDTQPDWSEEEKKKARERLGIFDVEGVTF